MSGELDSEQLEEKKKFPISPLTAIKTPFKAKKERRRVSTNRISFTVVNIDGIPNNNVHIEDTFSPVSGHVHVRDRPTDKRRKKKEDFIKRKKKKASKHHPLIINCPA